MPRRSYVLGYCSSFAPVLLSLSGWSWASSEVEGMGLPERLASAGSGWTGVRLHWMCLVFNRLLLAPMTRVVIRETEMFWEVEASLRRAARKPGRFDATEVTREVEGLDASLGCATATRMLGRKRFEGGWGSSSSSLRFALRVMCWQLRTKLAYMMRKETGKEKEKTVAQWMKGVRAESLWFRIDSVNEMHWPFLAWSCRLDNGVL